MSLAKRRIVTFLVAVLIVVLFYLMRGGYSISLELQENDSITVGGPQDITYSVCYEDIDAVELLHDFDPGECLEGGTKFGYSYGTWKSEAYGEYTFIAKSKAKVYIALNDTDSRVLVFDYEGDETTENLYQLILDLLEQRGISLNS